MGQLFLLLVMAVAEITINGINAVIDAVVHRENGQLVGCGSSFAPYEDVMYESALDQSRQAIGKVHLGDSKETVLSILSAPQGSPPLNFFKREAPSQIAIYYLRTNWIPDNCLTDDELTPFIFRDGVLASIGWRTLSGPKSFGTPDIDNS